LNIQTKGKNLIKEGNFRKLQYGNKEASKHTIWLMNDSVLILKKREKGKFNVRAEMPIDKIIVWDLDPNGNSLFEYF